EEGCDPAIEQRANDSGLHGPQEPWLTLDHLPLRELEEILDVLRGQPAGRRLACAKTDPFGYRENRPPDVIVEIEDQPRARGGDGCGAIQQLLHISGEIQRLRNDDDI